MSGCSYGAIFQHHRRAVFQRFLTSGLLALFDDRKPQPIPDVHMGEWKVVRVGSRSVAVGMAAVFPPHQQLLGAVADLVIFDRPGEINVRPFIPELRLVIVLEINLELSVKAALPPPGFTDQLLPDFRPTQTGIRVALETKGPFGDAGLLQGRLVFFPRRRAPMLIEYTVEPPIQGAP